MDIFPEISCDENSIAHGIVIGVGMEREIMPVFHDPTTMLGLLPFPYGLSSIERGIFYIAHGE
jgi:hypothetical protein